MLDLIHICSLIDATPTGACSGATALWSCSTNELSSALDHKPVPVVTANPGLRPSKIQSHSAFFSTGGEEVIMFLSVCDKAQRRLRKSCSSIWLLLPLSKYLIKWQMNPFLYRGIVIFLVIRNWVLFTSRFLHGEGYSRDKD